MGAYKRMKTACGAVLLTVLAGCSGDAPEARLRAAIDAMEAAIERRDAAGFLAHVAVNFDGNGGAVDRSTLRAAIAAQTLRHESIEVVLTPPTVKLHGEARATVAFSALVAGGAMLPERGRTLSIESGWQLVDGEWQCYAATWE